MTYFVQDLYSVLSHGAAVVVGTGVVDAGDVVDADDIAAAMTADELGIQRCYKHSYYS